MTLVVGGGEGLVGVDEVQTVVWHPRAFGRTGLVGTDIQAAIDLPGVGGDDLQPVDPVGELERQRGLAGRGRTAEDD